MNGGGVQLVKWQSDVLTKQALLPLPGNPRRAFENGGEMLAVSDSNVRSFSLARPEASHQTADLVIGTCMPYQPNYYYGGNDYSYHHGFFGCSTAPGVPTGIPVLVVGVLLFTARRLTQSRRRRAS